MISYWGVDHGDEVSKRLTKKQKDATTRGAVKGGAIGGVTGLLLAGPRGAVGLGVPGAGIGAAHGYLKATPKTKAVAKAADGEYNPNRSFKAQGLAYDKPGARKRASKLALKEAYSKEGFKTQGKHIAVGASGGAAIGALATRSTRGAAWGGYLGGLGGAYTGGVASGNKANKKAVAAGLKSGDIVRRPKEDITYFGGTRRN